MQSDLTLVDERGRRILVTVSFEPTGHELQWLAQFVGTTHSTGELAGTASDEASIPSAVQAAILQAGALAKGGRRA
ncbi:hypothetical protein ABIE56_000969 [Luteibacter sp. 621]|uniref:hypothetical protein n=1 Tax=Luteibacter sp. 621 TaxID=3373916 RepID=UPI003D2289FC